MRAYTDDCFEYNFPEGFPLTKQSKDVFRKEFVSDQLLVWESMSLNVFPPQAQWRRVPHKKDIMPEVIVAGATFILNLSK